KSLNRNPACRRTNRRASNDRWDLRRNTNPRSGGKNSVTTRDGGSSYRRCTNRATWHVNGNAGRSVAAPFIDAEFPYGTSTNIARISHGDSTVLGVRSRSSEQFRWNARPP